MYAYDQLAQRWNCTPWEAEHAEKRWQSYGMEMLSVEARQRKRRQ